MNGNEARHHQAVKAVKGKIYSKLGFVVTDVCYVLREDDYTNFWGKKHNYADGIFEINGFRFAVGSTAYGDGVYFDYAYIQSKIGELSEIYNIQEIALNSF